MSFDKFFSKSQDIANQQAANDTLGGERGYNLVTAREVGIFYPPDCPKHISQARINV